MKGIGGMKEIDRRRYFEQVLTNPFWGLVDVTFQLGVSRQRTTQLFRDYFGENYRGVHQIKQNELRQELACWDVPRHPVHFLSIISESSHWHRHFEAELKFIEELEKCGLYWRYKRKETGWVGTYFEVGGRPCRVAVRSCGRARLVCPTGPKYYKFAASLLPMDYLACLRPDTGLFYIVPSTGYIYIRSTENNSPWAGSNYIQYLEAFHLLK